MLNAETIGWAAPKVPRVPLMELPVPASAPEDDPLQAVSWSRTLEHRNSLSITVVS